MSSLSDLMKEDKGPDDLNDIFSEEPVSLTTFVRDKKFMHTFALSPPQYAAVRHIERIYYPDLYAKMGEMFETKSKGKTIGNYVISEPEKYWSEPIRMINYATIQWGKGSGKDHVARVAALRVAYLLLCLKSPQTYYGMPEHDSIHILNVAASSGQAKDAFFDPLIVAVKRGWFADRCIPIPGDGVIRWDKQVRAISGHADADSQEGKNLILGIADEVDAFRSKAEFQNRRQQQREPTKSVEGILRMLSSSAASRFPGRTIDEPGVWKNVRISYPRFLGSPIQDLTDKARKDNEEKGEKSHHYVSGPLATWEVNPRVIGPESFRDEYEADPIEARGVYECRPARAINPYFKNEMAVKECFKKKDVLPLTVTYRKVKSRESNEGFVWEPIWNFARDFHPIRGAIYVMHGDLAMKGDRAGIAMAHTVSYTSSEEVAYDEEGEASIVSERRPNIKVDFVIPLTADSSETPPREIQIGWAKQLFFELKKRGFYVKRFSFDGWQSLYLMQQLQRSGVDTKRVSTDVNEDAWKNLRDLMYEGRVEIPYDEDLETELLTLNKLPNGRVDHPPKGCFVEETRVPLLDGRDVQIGDLSDGVPVWVYASTDKGVIVPAKAVGRKTKMVTSLVDVVLDSGAVVRCTPEHLWRLRDGSYKEAQLLTKQDRLMSIARNVDYHGYERVSNREGHRVMTHMLVREYMDDAKLGPEEISHHDNEIKTDNRPENLIRMNRIEHLSHHARKQHAENAEYRNKVYTAQREYWATDEAKELQRKVMAKGLAWDGKKKAIAKLHSERIELLKREIDAKSVGAAAKRIGLARNSAISCLKSCGYKDWADFQQRVGVNHRIKFVERVELTEPVWVYDLEVDTHHNFALTAGVFVHNSKDLADALACSVMNAVAIGGQEDPEGDIAYFEAPVFEVTTQLPMPLGSENMPLDFGSAIPPMKSFGSWEV